MDSNQVALVGLTLLVLIPLSLLLVFGCDWLANWFNKISKGEDVKKKKK